MRRRVASVLAAFLLLASIGCGERNVVLITLDTTRPDHASVYGYARPTTPELERFAADAARFTQAITPMPTTDPAHVALLTGRYPFRSAVEENAIPLPETETTLAEILAGRGYATAAFVAVRHLGTRGYDQGFATFTFPREAHQVTGDVPLAEALGWLDRRPRGPFFLWLHLFDPHMDYNAPEPFKTRFGTDMPARYDGEIAFADACAGKLLARLAALGLDRRTAVVIASDHGENLGEPADAPTMPDYRFHHGNTVDEREVRVVLLMRLPGVTRGRTDVGTPASLIDVTPTVLDYLRVPPPRGVAFDGASLLPAIRRIAPAERIGFAYVNPARGPWTCARDARWKLVRDARDGAARLVDHVADPDGDVDGGAAAAAVRDRLGAALEDWDETKRAAIEARPPTSFEYDAKTIEMLRALGYLPAADTVKKP